MVDNPMQVYNIRVMVKIPTLDHMEESMEVEAVAEVRDTSAEYQMDLCGMAKELVMAMPK